MVFFMFFSCGELGFSSWQKHSRCLPPTKDKIGIFQSSEAAEGLWAERFSDTPMCQAVRLGKSTSRKILGRTPCHGMAKDTLSGSFDARSSRKRDSPLLRNTEGEIVAPSR